MPREGSGSLSMQPVGCTSWCSTDTDYMVRIMNEENDWDHNVKEDVVHGLLICVGREEIMYS